MFFSKSSGTATYSLVRRPRRIGPKDRCVVLLEERRAIWFRQADPNDAILRDQGIHVPVYRGIGGAEVRLRLDSRCTRDQLLIKPQLVGRYARLLLLLLCCHNAQVSPPAA